VITQTDDDMARRAPRYQGRVARWVRPRSNAWVSVVRILLTVSVALWTGGVFIPAAHADDRQYEEFYTPPDPLPPGQPGDLIRTEPSRLALEPSGQLGAFVGTGIRIMYR